MIKQSENIVWKPQKGSQVLALSCPIEEILLDGPRGTGKSETLLVKFMKEVGKGYGTDWRGIIFRTEYKELDDIVKKANKLRAKIFPKARFYKSAKEYKIVWSTGEELLFRAGKTDEDYQSHYHGHEYAFLGFEELTNWPDPDFYLSMKTTVRSARMGMPYFCIATTNPYGIGHHWVKERFYDKDPVGGKIIIDVSPNGMTRKRVRIYTSLQENKALLRARPTYIADIMSLKNKAKRDAWLYGDWNIAAGGYFEEYWNPRYNVVTPFTIPKSWKIDRSLDWGYTKPFSVGWWAESDGSDVVLPNGSFMPTIKGDLHRIHEWYGKTEGQINVGLRMGSTDVGLRIVEIDKKIEELYGIKVVPGAADSQIYSQSDQVITTAQQMANVGCFWRRSDKGSGSRATGWQLMGEMMEGAMTRERKGLFIWNTCKDFIKYVPRLMQDKVNLDDIDSDQEDHIADEARYRIQTKEHSTTVGFYN